jgi:hypothetical protein
MKFLLPILFVVLFSGTNTKKENVTQSQITITIVDENNNEFLPGVFELNSNKFSDLEGEMLVNKNDDIHLKLISYEEIKINNIKNDTIIKLKNNN